MLIDHEKTLAEFEAYIASKPSHGRNDLLVKLAELRAQNALAEGLPEQALRVLGNTLSDDLINQGHQPTDRDSHRVAAMAPEPDHRSSIIGGHGGTHVTAGRSPAHA